MRIPESIQREQWAQQRNEFNQRILEARQQKINEQNEANRREWENVGKLHSLNTLTGISAEDVEHRLDLADDDDPVKVQILNEVQFRIERELNKVNVASAAFPNKVTQDIEARVTKEVYEQLGNGSLMFKSRMSTSQLEMDEQSEALLSQLAEAMVGIISKLPSR